VSVPGATAALPDDHCVGACRALCGRLPALGGIPQATVIDTQRGKVYVNLQYKKAIAASIRLHISQSDLAIDLANLLVLTGATSVAHTSRNARE